MFLDKEDETVCSSWSDSSEAGSCSSVDLLAKREVRERYLKDGALDCLSPLRSLIAEKKSSKPFSPFQRQIVNQRRSVFHSVKKNPHSCMKHKKEPSFNSNLNFSQKFKCASTDCQKQSPSSDGGSGDCYQRQDNFNNEVQVLYSSVCPKIASTVSRKSDKILTSQADSFPFKSTPSGHYKLEPNQVVYESKNLSIVAADPKNVKLNITDPTNNVAPENKSFSSQENYSHQLTTSCLYTTVGPVSNIPFGETTDSFSESEGGGFQKTRQPSELSLSKMGYVNDNCIDWEELNLPKKSDLQTILMHNILTRVNTDTQITIGNSIHKCHRSVLQCYCSYFNLHPGLTVDLPENVVSKHVFELLYQWMIHKGTDSYQLLRRDNIIDISKAAQFLGMKELEEQCWAFIDNVDVFNEDKAFLLYLDARKNNNKDIMELMVPRVQRFFLTLVSSKEFVEFSAEEVCTFLHSNYIGVNSEIEVFMSAVRWLNHDWSQRKNQAVELMKCVRFGLIDPTVLLSIRRNPHSPEFHRVANIPEVSQMIDDGIYLIVSNQREKISDEEYLNTLKSLGLTHPMPRNWVGADRKYLTYQDFLKDLAHYRSEQRYNIRRSKTKLQIDEMLENDFLSSAVLAPSSQQKICKKLLNIKDGSLIKCLPHLQPKDFDLLKQIICQDDIRIQEKSKEIKSKITPSAKEDKHKTDQKVKQHRKVSKEDLDDAARTIQKAYRSYSKKGVENYKEPIRKKPNIIYKDEDMAARKIQKAYRSYSKTKIQISPTSSTCPTILPDPTSKSKSDPSIPSTLLQSSTQPLAENVNERLFPNKSRDSVFIFGGSNPFQIEDYRSSSLSIFQFEICNNTWRQCGHLPNPLHYHSSIYFLGKIYIAGGKDPGKMIGQEEAVSQKFWRFDPKSKEWSRRRDMLHARRSFGLVACNNKLFAIGGKDENDSLLASVEMYNVEEDVWKEVKSLSIARAGLAAAEFKGRIWVAGGLVNDKTATNSVEYYNVHRNTWTKSASMQYSLCFSSMVVVREQLYVVGGAIGLPDCELQGSCKQVILWNPEDQAWCLASTLSKPRHAHAAVYLRGDTDKGSGQVFVMGGMSSKHQRVMDAVECWQEANDHWIMGVASIPYPVSGLSALVLPSDIFS